MRSIQRRRARPSPSRAFEITVCVRASALHSGILSIASVFLFPALLCLPKLPAVNLLAVLKSRFMKKGGVVNPAFLNSQPTIGSSGGGGGASSLSESPSGPPSVASGTIAGSGAPEPAP